MGSVGISSLLFVRNIQCLDHCAQWKKFRNYVQSNGPVPSRVARGRWEVRVSCGLASDVAARGGLHF